MKFASSVFAALGLNAALLADVAAPAAASDSDVYPPTKVKVARSNQAGDEETPAATSAQQHLRRANVFNSSNGNVNIIVVLKDDGRRRRKLTGNGQETAAEKKAAAEENKAAAAAAAASMGAVATVTYGTALFGFAASVPPGQRKQIEEDPRVDYVEDDATVQLSPIEMGGDRRRLPGKPGGGGDVAQTTPWGISRVKGGASNQSYGTAWVIDSGIDLDHPDLNVDVDRSRYCAGQSPNDENGHGTHVAGTIAAIHNNIGVVGVAAGALVVSVRVLDRRGSGTYSCIIAGVDHVAANCGPNDVANMSLGGGKSETLNNAVIAASANCPFVLAAGNESTDAGSNSPASAEGNNIYTVSAFSNGDKWASFSNYGDVVDYAEPGVSIHSTWKGGGYNTISGTSMAAPHLAGILLVGSITPDGTVTGDPDSKKEPIGVC